MLFLRRLILWFSPAIWIAGMELVNQNPTWGLLIGGILLLYLIFAVWYLEKCQINKSFFHFLILPVFFGLTSFVFCSFLVTQFSFYSVVIISAAFLYLLFRQYYFYFNYPFKYQPYSLESLSLYMCLVTGFFLFSGCFGGLILIQLNIFLLAAILAVITGLITYQFFWIHKFELGKSRLFIGCIALILVELFVVVGYLPTGYYVNSFILTAAYYLMLGFSKHFLTNTLTTRRVATYVIIAIVSVVVVLLTAQWS